MIDQLNEPALTALPDETPVTMLNLMRFRAQSLDGYGSGWDAYLRYSKLTIRLIKAQGGTIIWTGDAETVALGAPERHRWDYVALVR
jgi:PBP1b-binding outer membrane lipoprotein LpoB